MVCNSTNNSLQACAWVYDVQQPYLQHGGSSYNRQNFETVAPWITVNSTMSTTQEVEERHDIQNYMLAIINYYHSILIAAHSVSLVLTKATRSACYPFNRWTGVCLSSWLTLLTCVTHTTDRPLVIFQTMIKIDGNCLTKSCKIKSQSSKALAFRGVSRQHILRGQCEKF